MCHCRKEREGSPESEYRTYNGSCGSRRSSLGGSAEPQHVAPDRVRFARDTSHYWYKPNISRDDGTSSRMLSNDPSSIQWICVMTTRHRYEINISQDEYVSGLIVRDSSQGWRRPTTDPRSI